MNQHFFIFVCVIFLTFRIIYVIRVQFYTSNNSYYIHPFTY